VLWRERNELVSRRERVFGRGEMRELGGAQRLKSNAESVWMHIQTGGSEDAKPSETAQNSRDTAHKKRMTRESHPFFVSRRAANCLSRTS